MRTVDGSAILECGGRAKRRRRFRLTECLRERAAFGARRIPAPRVLISCFAFGLAVSLFAQHPALEEGRSRFSAVDIYLDAKGTPLAAYQLEFRATNAAARIVGIEGGEHPAFAGPPFYDPEAMHHERVILAAFSAIPTDKLPAGKTRVATIHLQNIGNQKPALELKLQTAADSAGTKISAAASFEERKTK